jgi:DNA processing protein
MRRIAENGLIVSEYPPGTPPERFRFPLRNRIISGLSRAVVIVEAGLKSGSLITAERAAEQGRDVYAVPGNINRKTSIGCNKLIADGAIPLMFPDDIVRDVGLAPKTGGIAGAADANLTGLEKSVLGLVAKEGELSPDAVAMLLKRDIRTILPVIAVLEMKGLVATSSGKVLFA